MRPSRTLLAALALAVAAPPALAQEAEPDPNVLGAWTIEVNPTYDRCSLTGQAIIRSGPTPNTFLCEIVAEDVCPGVWSYRAEQTCTATRKGDQLTIVSELQTVEPETDRYWPDNFRLTVVNGSLMVGELLSAVVADARFYRTAGPIS